ncbi:MAG: hypothetical protein GF315_04230 [candidate division Zixibacteria bacterium]|nr:hypothetical protein [candidate division Zixibacteria bacterium]
MPEYQSQWIENRNDFGLLSRVIHKSQLIVAEGTSFGDFAIIKIYGL